MRNLFLFRCFIIMLVALSVRWLLDLEVSYGMIAASLIAGATFSYTLNQQRFTFLGFLVVSALVAFSYIGMEQLFDLLPATGLSTSFIFDLWRDSVTLFLIGASIVALLSWFFVRLPGYPTIELLGLIGTCLITFASHRNFNFDNPILLSDLAWRLNLEPLTLLVTAGFFVSLMILAYSVMVARWEMVSQSNVWLSSGSERRGRRVVFAMGVIGIIALFGHGLFRFYFQQQQLRVAQGVGQASEEGISPLGFNSAMGSTRQPAAVIRLDGDYAENPFQPMMYIRENALSSLGNHELVIAPGTYDTDLHRTAPNERFEIEPPKAPFRKQLSFSSYLLANHNLSFAIDFPISINPIKNPNPEKFKGAFHAVSLVPTFPLAALEQTHAGDSSWNAETRAHYLETVSDPRYGSLAARLVGNQALSSAAAAQKIVQYLSENSIYTLTPNHSVPKGDDQVAPYLFGDMRGYCVHFAHATVFMLRALGIPSRIGTGYLTDLSKAKDGHLLLRMSDRHAWAEVYFEGYGWIPFDTKPTRVESHGNSEMDYKLLEELMGMLGNDEFLPAAKKLDEPGLQQPLTFEMPLNQIPWLELCVTLLGLLVALKVWIRYSWLLPSSVNTKIFRAYRSLISILHDIGMHRHRGETFVEFQQRMSRETPLKILSSITPLAVASKLDQAPSLTQATLKTLIDAEYALIGQLPWTKKMLALLNPSSCVLLLKRSWP